jgi:hypothetical protein
MTGTKGNVIVYVRLGSTMVAYDLDAGLTEYSRTLSLQLPKEIPQVEALKKGFAIDGNSYTMEITPCQFVDMVGLRHGGLCGSHGEQGYALMDVLRDTQLDIMKWLGEYDYEVTYS